MCFVRLQFDGLDDNQKAMMKMLRDTCLQESGSEEGKCAPSARRHVKLCLKYSNAFLQSITSDSTIIFVSHMTGKQSLHKPGEVQRVPGG